MIVVLLTYRVAPEDVAPHRTAHVDWLNKGVAEGRVLMAGRKATSDGGMFMVRGQLDEIKAWAATDPFAVQQLADYEFVEIVPSILAPGLEAISE